MEQINGLCFPLMQSLSADGEEGTFQQPVSLGHAWIVFLRGTAMSKDFIYKPDDPGYIVAWKYKYEFKAGKYEDEIMTYGEAQKRAEELRTQHPDMTFWPEKVNGELANRFYNPEAH